jgi:hypothetical protein
MKPESWEMLNSLIKIKKLHLSEMEKKKIDQAKNAFLAGVIRGWTSRLQEHNTEKQACISDMLDFSNMIAKSAGVIITDD